MKRIVAVIIVISMALMLFSCSDEKTNNIVTTTQITEEITDEITEEEQTTKQMVFIEESTIVFDNGTYRFEIPKTDFEKRYSEELLLQFANMLSMSFGVEDYYDWNTTGQNIFKDVRCCTLSVNHFMLWKNFIHEQSDDEAVSMFWEASGLENIAGDLGTFNLRDFNRYLVRMFGPDVRQLKTEDFDTGKTAAEKGVIPIEGIGESDFRCYYSGKEDVMIFQFCPTGYGCVGEYIYNVEKIEDDYYVYTVGEIESHGLITDFEEFQSQALKDMPYTIYRGWLPSKVYKFGCAENGDVFLKSVEQKHFVGEYDYIVDSDCPIEVKGKKAITEEYRVIGTLEKGEKVRRFPMFETVQMEKNGECIIVTEDYIGIVEIKYLKEIEK